MLRNPEKYQRQIALLCPTCGATEFEYDDENQADEAPMKCMSCFLELTKAQLIESNQENISTHQNEIAKSVFDDFEKQIKAKFKGSKFIKIK